MQEYGGANLAADGTNNLENDPAAVLERSAPLVSTTVMVWGEELGEQVLDIISEVKDGDTI